MCEPVTTALGLTTAALGAGSAAAGAAGGVVGLSSAALAAGSTAGGILGSGISAGTALGLGGTLLSTGLSMFGRMAGSAQQQGLYIQNAVNQNKALAQNYNGIGLRQSQIADKAQSDNFDVLRGLAIAKGKATAAAGEAGVGGVSFASLVSDLEMRDGAATGNNNYNYTAGIQNSQNEKDAAKSRTESNIASMPQANPLSLYAGLAADGINGALKIYDTGRKGGLWNFDDTPTGTTNIK